MTEHWTPVSDDLLEDLAALLAPEPVTPRPEAIESLRQAVMQRWPSPILEGGSDRGGATSPWWIPLLRWPRTRWGRTAGAVGVLAGLTIGGSGVAFAVGTVPEPIRAAAHALGLPVDSPALSAAKNAERRLRAVLVAGSGRSPAPASATAADARALARRMAQLSPSDRRQLGSTPNLLLGEAQSYESEHAGPTTSRPATSLPATSLPSDAPGHVRNSHDSSPAANPSDGTPSNRGSSDHPAGNANPAGTSHQGGASSGQDHPSTATTVSSPTSDVHTWSTSQAPQTSESTGTTGDEPNGAPSGHATISVPTGTDGRGGGYGSRK